MFKLQTYRFCDLYDISSGISSKPEQAGHGAPFLSFSTVFNNYFLPNELPDLMDTSDQEQKVYSIQDGDIFLTRTSETLDELGMSSVAVKDYSNATYSGFLKRLRPKQKKITYPKFMAFYLRSNLFRKTMNNNAIMTLRASLNEQIFSYINLSLPPLDEQKKIGDFLYSISQKIEINNRINNKLEQIIKTLYDYWFVQFEFPDAQGNPYKLSGGKMVFNNLVNRAIPEEWKANNIGCYCEVIRGVTYNKSDLKDIKDESVIGILRATNITGNKVDINDLMYVDASLVSEKQLLKPFDLIITMSSGSKDHIGKNGFYLFDEKDKSIGAFCSKLEIKNDYKYLLYTYFQSQAFKSYVSNT
jgi:type I restriction enzyme, S subunit